MQQVSKEQDFGTWLVGICDSWGGRPFLLESRSGQTISYADIREGLEKASLNLAGLGLSCGDRVVLELGNRVADLTRFFGCIQLGVVPVIVSPQARPDELAYNIEKSNAKAVFTSPSRVDLLRQHLSCPVYERENGSPQRLETGSAFGKNGDDTAYIVFTSGSTGLPKMVHVSHRNMLAEIDSMAQGYDFTQDDRHLCLLPLYHASGLYRSLLLPLASGGFVVLNDEFQNETFWEEITSHRITFVQVVPAILKELLQHSDNLDFDQTRMLQRIGSASAPHPVALVKAFEERFSVYVLQSYGMTEATCGITLNPLNPAERKPGSVGRPLSVNRIEVLSDDGEILGPDDEGRIVVYGDNITSFFDPAMNEDEPYPAMSAGGFLETGDIGRVDSDGFVWLTSRSQDMIKRGGYRMSPGEIEDAISGAFPELDVAALGVPHPLLGQDVIAFVAPYLDGLTSRQILRGIKGRLSSVKIPSDIIVMKALPRLGVGKIDKKRLLADYLGDTSTGETGDPQ